MTIQAVLLPLFVQVLLTCRTSELDRRAKLLSIQELDTLLGGRQETVAADRKVA